MTPELIQPMNSNRADKILSSTEKREEIGNCVEGLWVLGHRSWKLLRFFGEKARKLLTRKLLKARCTYIHTYTHALELLSSVIE